MDKDKGKGKEDVVVIVDFSLTRLVSKDGVVIMRRRLCDVGGVLDIASARKINDEVGKALMEMR